MNDAGELLLTLYEQIGAGAAAARAFGLQLGVDLDAVVGLPVGGWVVAGGWVGGG